MIRELILSVVYLSFIGAGFVAPFITTLGYLWVDTLRPQELSYFFLSSIPVSFIMAAAALSMYFMFDRKNPPPIHAQTIITLIFGAWVTFTTIFAVSPTDAWPKWDWAFKTILFSAFIPFVIRTRVQIEAFIQVYIFSLAVHFMAAGVKTMLGGGGYGRSLSAAGNSNTGLAESSTLAAVSIMVIPLILYLMRHSVLMPRIIATRLVYGGLVVIALAAAVGTYARTGLIGLIVLAGAVWLTTKQKFLVGTIIVVTALVIGTFASATWSSRISTIQDYQSESSALGRILVWKWTLEFVRDRPIGGGFNSYVVNEITFPPSTPDGEPVVSKGKAFHSIYFEVLGEHGYPGAMLFFGLIAVTLNSLVRSSRAVKGRPDLQWCDDLAKALLTSFVVLLVCGAFIGIAFQPMLYYMFALGVSVSTLATRLAAPALEEPQPPRQRVARSVRGPRTAPASPASVLPTWRR